MENEEVFQETENLEGDSNTETEENILVEEESVDVLKERLSKAEEISRNQKIRAEKAEKALKQAKTAPAKAEKETPKNETSNEDDLYALIEAKVPKEDVKEVRKAAKLLGVSIAEALNDPIVKTILSTKAEERATAQVANVATNKRGVHKETGESLLQDFEKGVVSEKDEDIEKLVAAQMARRRAMAKRN